MLHLFTHTFQSCKGFFKLYEPILSTQALFKSIETNEAFRDQVIDNGLINAALWHRSPNLGSEGNVVVKDDLNVKLQHELLTGWSV